MATSTVGNVSLTLKHADGSMLQDATGWRHTLLVGAYRQDEPGQADDWLNAITFGGSLIAIDPPELQAHKDALARMIDETGCSPADHALLHADLFSSRNTWTDPAVGVWPEWRHGDRLSPGPGLWFRVWAPPGTIVGATIDLSKRSLPPFQTPTIDGRKELTSLSTCAQHMTLMAGKPLKPRPVRIAMWHNAVHVFTIGSKLRRSFGTRYVPRGLVSVGVGMRTDWSDPDPANWTATDYVPPGLYSSWFVSATDVITGRTDTALLLVAGYSTRLHPGFPWNLNSEHWGAGSDYQPQCVSAMNIEVLRADQAWHPAPRVHFHSRMETPNHRVFAGNNAVVISTEDVALPEVKLNEIIDPRRVA